jgi:hypothetical protein
MPWKVVELVKAHGCMDIAIELENNFRRKNRCNGVHLYAGSVGGQCTGGSNFRVSGVTSRVTF